MQLTYGQKISPFPVHLQGVGHFKSPKMSEIYNPDVGDGIYYSYLCLLSNDTSVVLRLIGKDKAFPQELVSSIDAFDLWCTLPDNLIQMLLLALNFFIVEDVVFDRSKQQVNVLQGDETTGCINRDNFSEVCDLIKQLNFLSRKPDKEREKLKFRNEAARKLHEKLYGSADDEATQDSNPDMELSNLISVIATKSKNYNYENVWNLTVCQLYDVFFRENNNIAIDAAIMRWCIWGTDYCEAMNEWYKSIELKEEK